MTVLIKHFQVLGGISVVTTDVSSRWLPLLYRFCQSKERFSFPLSPSTCSEKLELDPCSSSKNSLETSKGNTPFGIGLLSGQNAQETPVTVSSLGHLAALLSCGLKDWWYDLTEVHMCILTYGSILNADKSDSCSICVKVLWCHQLIVFFCLLWLHHEKWTPSHLVTPAPCWHAEQCH